MASEHAALVAAERENDRMRRALAKIKTESKNALRHGVNSAVTVGTAFGIGYAETKWQDSVGKGIMGVPLGLAIGGAAFIAGSMGLTGEDDLVLAVANGALAAVANQKGREAGSK